jgi:2-amino-4-hydroxy-6-hydroxymethyldihydropteridine diphosphokinase
MEKTVYLSLGSNLGDRARNLQDAIERLRSLGEVAAVSSFYETEPVGDLHQSWFLNCAVMLRTEKMPRQLLAAVMAIEQALGRKRTVAKGPRTIDIDIILFGRVVVDVPSLMIPHPAMHERRFVLQPLAEIAPEVRHPIFHRTIHELLEDLPLGAPQVRKLDDKATGGSA